MDRPRISFVETAAELHAVARFRYSVYVQEMGRFQPDADHRRQTILDELDDGGYVAAAWYGDEVVGTVRISLCGSSSLGAYPEWYNAACIAGSAWPVQSAILTRLSVAQHLRGSMLGIQLCAAAFAFGADRGIKCALMDCNEHLLPFFAKIGWRLQGAFEHPHYGWVYTHSFNLADEDYLREIRSPFVRLLRQAPLGEYGQTKAISRVLLQACDNLAPVEAIVFSGRAAA